MGADSEHGEPRVTCTACNHQHPTMAVLWHDDETVTLLCHEDDHSCYEEFVREGPGLEDFVNRLTS